MKIVCYVRPFYPMAGGLENIADLVSRHLAGAGHEVTIVTEAPLRGCEELADARRVIRRPGFYSLWRSFRTCDVILFFGLSLRAWPVAFLAFRPIILSHHGVYPSAQGHIARLVRGLRLLPAKCHPNVCVSHYVERSIPGRTMVIHNAYDDSVFGVVRSRASESYTFVFCGRMVSEKGVALLLNAFAAVAKDFPEVNLLLIGDGPDRPEMESMAVSMGMRAKVEFIGEASPTLVAEYLRKCRVLVVPSIGHESFGIVALEGLASGCRVVVTCQGGLPEAVNGFGEVVNPDAVSLAGVMSRAARCAPSTNKGVDELSRYLRARSIRSVGRKYEQVIRLVARG